MNLRIQPHSAFPLPASLEDLDATNARVDRQESSTPITVAPGDGIGPEIMKASLDVLLEAGANIVIDQVQIGETSGIGADAWESIRRTRVLLKAPTGGSMKSVSETLRRTLDLFLSVRPCAAYHPFVASEYPALDLVVIRENGYSDAEIDDRQNRKIGDLRKVLSRASYESIARYAFEYAVRNGRQKVSCFTPHNIMKQTEGLFHTGFQEVASDYPGVEHEVLTLEAGAAQLANEPRRFDVIVLPNASSDCLAQRIMGPVGLLPSVSLGSEFAVFEAAQSATAALAGLDIANPSGMILAGAMMLRHIGQIEAADRVQDALLTTLEQGIHTSDIFCQRLSTEKVGTQAFGAAVIRNLGQEPKRLKPRRFATSMGTLVSGRAEDTKAGLAIKRLIGVDVFVRWRGRRAGVLAQDMRAIPNRDLELSMISNQGLQVWPMAAADLRHKSDLWRCRYTARDGRVVDHATIANLLMDLAYLEIDFTKTEHLYGFDDAISAPPRGEINFPSARLKVATAC